MSFGFSPGDVIEALKVTKQICEVWFDKVKRADNQYLQFGEDVSLFAESLEALSNVFVQAPSSSNRALNANRIKALDRQRREVIGDFRQTLRQCQQLLQDNAKYLQKNATFLENLEWHFLGTQERATNLRARLQFHALKINLILEPLKAELLLQVAGEVRALRDDVSRLPRRIWDTLAERSLDRAFPEQLPAVPSFLEKCFTEALEEGKPASYTTIADFPLKEGLDALIFHFKESTKQFTGTGLGIWIPQVKHINNLFKARWIFEKLVGSSHLREAGSGSLWAHSLENIFRELECEYDKHKRRIDAATDSVVKLGKEYFFIWVPQEASEPLKLITDADLDKSETKILEVPLLESTGYSKSDLFIFRRPNNDMRLVRADVQEGYANSREGRTIYGRKIINMHSFAYVPHYASSPATMPSRTVETCHIGVSSGDKYTFRTDEDLHKFQQALLGYKVNYDKHSRWTVHSSSLFSKSTLSGKGRIQVWQPKPITEWPPPSGPTTIASPLKQRRMTGTSTDMSFDEQICKDPLLAQAFQAVPQSASTQVGRTIVEQERPQVPKLVIYTRLEGRKGFLHLPLDSEIMINNARCGCGDPCEATRLSCCVAVIERKPPSRAKFKINRHETSYAPNGEPMPTSWNLSLFSLDRHPGFNSIDKIKDVTWLSIEFNTPSDRTDFQETFETINIHRDYLDRLFFENSTALRYRSHRPSNGQNSVPISSHRRFGSHSTVLKSSEASEKAVESPPAMSSSQ